MVLEDSHWTNTDPWFILYEPCPDVKQLSPGSSLGWTWDQSLLTVEINTITRGKRHRILDGTVANGVPTLRSIVTDHYLLDSTSV